MYKNQSFIFILINAVTYPIKMIKNTPSYRIKNVDTRKSKCVKGFEYEKEFAHNLILVLMQFYRILN
jgi:hypothetical protein